MKSDLLLLFALLLVAGVSAWGWYLHRRHAAGRLYRRMLENALADGRLTPDEERELQEFREEREITEAEARVVARAVYRAALRSAAEDARLSSEEEGNLARLQADLGLSDADLGEDRDALGRLRLLARVEIGQLPLMEAPLALVPQEVCHWVAPASLAERLELPGRGGGEPQGAVIALSGGHTAPVAAKLGALRPSADVLPVDIGVLMITSRRTVFQGAKRTVSVPHARLESMAVYADGFRLDELGGNTRAVLLVEDAELGAAILLAAARRRREEIRPTRRDRTA
jgi:hypothetical protein